MRREDDRRSWKTAINAGKRALRHLSEASGSDKCHFVGIPDPLEMELMIAQCQLQLGETASAAEAAQTALHAAEENGMNRYSREACELLQKISAAQKDWDGALRWGKRAVRYGDGTYRDYREGVFHFPISVQLPPLELCAEACRYLGRDEKERAYILRIKALQESQERFGADRQDG